MYIGGKILIDTFVPKRLIEARADIVFKHRKLGEVIDITPNERLKKLIERFVVLEKTEVKKNALALTKEEVVMIVGYLPHNYFDVNMDNLFLVFDYRCTRWNCEILFYEWQNSYQNQQCNLYMKRQLQDNLDFIWMIHNKNLTEKLFGHILSAENIAIQFGKACVKGEFPENYTLYDKMNYFSIRENTKLYYDIEFLFYTFCCRNDYLVAIKEELMRVIKKYENSEKRSFLVNFLSVLNLEELDHFQELARYFNSILGEPTSEKAKLFFKGISDAIQEKYHDWLNRLKINQYFGNDERSRFWQQYKFLSVDKNRSSNSVVMEFKEYYAIEFLGDAMGPIYLYERGIFERNIINLMNWYNNSELRSILYHHSELYFERIVHIGYWQSKVDNILLKNHITEKVRW